MNSEIKNLELLDAAFAGGTQKVKSILDKELTVEEANFWGKKAMKFAIVQGHSEIMKLLLERGFYTINTGIYAAIFLEKTEMLIKLLKNNTNATQNAFIYTVNLGKTEILKTLLGVYDVDLYEKRKDGKSIMDIVKEKNNKKIIDVLSNYEYKNNQLILACKSLNVNNVKMFLKKGAKTNFMDENGETALTYSQKAYCKDESALARQVEIISLLNINT